MFALDSANFVLVLRVVDGSDLKSGPPALVFIAQDCVDDQG